MANSQLHGGALNGFRNSEFGIRIDNWNGILSEESTAVVEVTARSHFRSFEESTHCGYLVGIYGERPSVTEETYGREHALSAFTLSQPLRT